EWHVQEPRQSGGQPEYRAAVHRHGRQAEAIADQWHRARERRRSPAWRDRRRATHRPRRSAGDLSELSALYPDDAAGRSIDLRATAKMRSAGTGLEKFRRVQRRRSSTSGHVERLSVMSAIALGVSS